MWTSRWTCSRASASASTARRRAGRFRAGSATPAPARFAPRATGRRRRSGWPRTGWAARSPAKDCARIPRRGDRAIGGLLGQLGGEIDATDTPDLVPALAVAAAVHPGTTRITGAARLRLKESDRLSAVAQMLRALGGRAEETADGLMIEGVARLKGGEVDGQNDHRIVMAAAIAATVAAGPVRITGAEAVEKSYPAFFDDFRRLGGRVRLEP